MTYIFIDELKSAEEVEKDLNKKQHNHDTASVAVQPAPGQDIEVFTLEY